MKLAAFVVGTICILTGSAWALESLDSILVNGQYRMSLSTGDVLEGIVESKTDSNLTLDCKGSGYVFTKYIIKKYELLVAPPQAAQSTAPSGPAPFSDEFVSFDHLKRLQSSSQPLVVLLKAGPVFKGTFISIDDQDMLRIMVEQSVIPISKEAIKEISYFREPAKPTVEAPKGPFDSVYVRSAKVDEWGKRAPDDLFVGTVVSEGDKGVVFRDGATGTTQTFPFDVIAKTVRHTTNSYEEPISRYAKPLYCPAGMAYVDVPPGKGDRPFFKVCIDIYEYPNKNDLRPQSGVSYADAVQLCKSQGKRLCTAEEWQYSCSGVDRMAYPYGNDFVKGNCNTESSTAIENSGYRYKCTSKFGTFDMTGNVFEWVTGANNEPTLMGGPLSKCQSQSPGGAGEARPLNGVRCCKGN